MESVLEPMVPPPDRSGEAYRNAYAAGGGFGGVPASGEAIAGLKRLKHGDDGDDDDDHAVSRQTKRPRHGTGVDDETTTATGGEEAAACAICLEDLKDGGGLLAEMPCAHRFHDGCLTEWLAISRVCPCCRHALPSDGEGEGKAPRPRAATGATSVADVSGAGARLHTRPRRDPVLQARAMESARMRMRDAAMRESEEAATTRRAVQAAAGTRVWERAVVEAATTTRALEATRVGETPMTRRSRRARQANVRLFGPEWTADTSDDGLSLQQ